MFEVHTLIFLSGIKSNLIGVINRWSWGVLEFYLPIFIPNYNIGRLGLDIDIEPQCLGRC